VHGGGWSEGPGAVRYECGGTSGEAAAIGKWGAMVGGAQNALSSPSALGRGPGCDAAPPHTQNPCTTPTHSPPPPPPSPPVVVQAEQRADAHVVQAAPHGPVLREQPVVVVRLGAADVHLLEGGPARRGRRCLGGRGGSLRRLLLLLRGLLPLRMQLAAACPPVVGLLEEREGADLRGARTWLPQALASRAGGGA
jgi:hypothetical protein